MNTEQLKTAEQILENHTGKQRGHVNDFSIYEKEAIQAMQDFASQESKRAVDEFKEKLREDIKYMRNRTFKQDGMPVGENEDFVRGCDDILDLIDKL